MCSIFGAALRNVGINNLEAIESVLRDVWLRAHARGRDGRGYITVNMGGYPLREASVARFDGTPDVWPHVQLGRSSILGNLRAEPTTEYVNVKTTDDQQPYSVGKWSIVHNGTIANDKGLRTHALPTTIDSAAIAEQLADTVPTLAAFADVVRGFQGSFAILAAHQSMAGVVFVAANYRPVWYIQVAEGYVFASSRDHFPEGFTPVMLAPYTVARFDAKTQTIEGMDLLPELAGKQTALVVCSGGLDSVVSAALAKRMGYDLHLIHFRYGSRAEYPEVNAVNAVAQALGAKITVFDLPVYAKGDSPLLDADAKVAGGEEGAEFAHEWVPARNLVLLSVATAFAEARGYSTIVLGNNLEEAGAYPDNEPEFIARFNDLLPFAVGANKRMKVIMPVGNLMKHEIVATGHELRAPMHLTWSCYRAGDKHCGTCGPCYMRRKAFDINNLPEVLEYER